MITILAEHEAKAHEMLPAEIVDYYASGAGDEVTVRAAEAAWERFLIRPMPLRDVAMVDTSVTLFGDRFETPVGVAPTAFHRLAHLDGEAASIAGAEAAGSLFVLSTRASLRFREVAAATSAPWWFQVYVMRDRDLTARVVMDAVDAGARALVLTGDTPYVGRKRRVDGIRIPMPDDHYLININRHLSAGVDGRAAATQDPSIGLQTINWLKELTGLPVIVKGVLRGDAALACLDAGADGIIVSNHGGRQLDRAVPSACALAEVVDMVAGRAPVMVDGGIRSGLDVLVALALGASAVFVGRPVLWGLAAGGADGVRDALTALTDDLLHVLALSGAASLADLDSRWVTTG